MNEAYTHADPSSPAAPTRPAPASRPVSIVIPLLLTIGIIAAVVVDVARRWGDEDYGPLPSGVACRPLSNESGCFDPAPETAAAFTDVEACRAGGVCLVPMGNVALWLIEDLRDRLSRDLGMEVGVLPPVTVAREDFIASRRSVPAAGLLRTLEESYGRGCCDERAVFIGLTSMNMQGSTVRSTVLAERRALGRDTFLGVISTYELDASDRDLLVDRAEKLSSGYIGLDYFKLEASPHPTNPLFAGPRLAVYHVDQMGHVRRGSDGKLVFTTR